MTANSSHQVDVASAWHMLQDSLGLCSSLEMVPWYLCVAVSCVSLLFSVSVDVVCFVGWLCIRVLCGFCVFDAK